MIATETSKRAKHAKYVLTPWSKQAGLNPPVMERGEGVYLFDTDGNKYLDFSAGLVAVNLGHGNTAVAGAIAEQAERLAYASPQFFLDVRADLAEALSELSPWDEGARVFFTTNGGEGNEDAIKMSRMITGRNKVLAAYRSFHGSAPGAGSLTGENRRWPNEPGWAGVVHFVAPFPYDSPFHTEDPKEETRRALEHLDLVLTYENPAAVAAIVLEPLVGSNGVVIYPDGYLAGIRERCDRHGIVLIFDEVMTGFGRTGEVFASKTFGVTPDIITFAKGVTSAYAPLGGAIVREKLAKYFDDHALMCGHTYSGHPVSVAAGYAAIQEYKRQNLFTRGHDIEGWLRKGLEGVKAHCQQVGDVRGKGAFFALEFVKDRATKQPIVGWQGADPGPLPGFLKKLRDHGVYAFGRYGIVLITPPLTITQEQVQFGCDAIEKTLKEVGAF